MDLVGTTINAVVVTVAGLVLGWMFKGRLESIDRRFDSIERRLDGMQGSMDALRSDLTQVALAVGVRPRATNA